MATYSVKINIAGTWYEYPASRKGFKRSIKLYNSSLKPCLNTMKVNIKWSDSIWGLLLGSTESYAVAIEKDGADFFTGIIPATLKDRIKKVQTSIKLSILDTSHKLKTNITASINYRGFKVCDTADKANSIVHQLLYAGGYADDEILITENILEVITVFSADQGKTSYWKLLENLLYEYHHAFNSDASGRFTLVNWGIRSLIPLATVGDGGKSLSDLTINKCERKYSSVELTWYKVENITNALIYRDSIDINDIGEAILSGFSYPVVEEDEEIEQSYSAEWIDGEKPEILYTSNHDLQTQLLQLKPEDEWGSLNPEYQTATGVTIESTFDIKNARIVIINANTETVWLKYLDIRADVIAKIKEVISHTSYDGNIKSYKSKYIETKSAANSFATSLDAFYMYCDSSLSFSSLDNLYEGSVYNVKFAKSSLNTKVIITQRIDTASSIIKYTCIPLDNLTARVVTTKEIQDELSQSLMIQRAVFEQMSDRPTFNQLIDGHDNYGQTTTPFKLTDVKTESHLNCIEINWPIQTNLSNLKEYRLQISADGNTWYSLGEGLGELNGYTTITSTMYLHTNIPPVINGETSEPATYFYRVAQVTVLNVVSGWSNLIQGWTLLVEGDVLARNAIRANHIKAGEIKSSHLEVGTIDAKSIGLLGQNVNPGTEMIDESMHWNLRVNNRSNQGGTIPLDTDVIQSGKDWESKGESDSFSDADSLNCLFNGEYKIGETYRGSFDSIKNIKCQIGIPGTILHGGKP